MFVQADNEVLIFFSDGTTKVLTIQRDPDAYYVEVEGASGVQSWPTKGPAAVRCIADLIGFYLAEAR